jgi:aminoglycoside 6'-N-acetyltransferase
VTFAGTLPDRLIGDPTGVHLARLCHDHMPIIERFFDDPVVDQVFGGRASATSEIRSHIDSDHVSPFLILEREAAHGYLQMYHANAEDFWTAFGVPKETFGLDLFLAGEGNRRRGLGLAAITLACTRLWQIPEIVRIQIDPDPGNAPAIRAYEKAGFMPVCEAPGYEGAPMLYMAIGRG